MKKEKEEKEPRRSEGGSKDKRGIYEIVLDIEKSVNELKTSRETKIEQQAEGDGQEPAP